MERGFSINLEPKEKVLLFDPGQAASEVASVTGTGGAPRSAAQSQFVHKSGSRLSYSINAEEPYDEPSRPMTTENNEIIEEHKRQKKPADSPRDAVRTISNGKGLIPLEENFQAKEKERQKLFDEL